MKPSPRATLRPLTLALSCLALPACRGMDALISDREPAVLTDTQEPKRYLEQDTPIDTDLGSGQKFMLTEFVELKERNQELERERDRLQRALTEAERKWRESETERLREHNDRLAAQAQLGSRAQELRELQARILDLQIQRSRLQQKVYLLSLAGREKDLEGQLRVGQGYGPEAGQATPGR